MARETVEIVAVIFGACSIVSVVGLLLRQPVRIRLRRFSVSVGASEPGTLPDTVPSNEKRPPASLART
jgi:hypothetical protein